MAEAALRGLGSRQRSRRLFAAGMILVGGLGIVAAAAPWLTAYDPDAIVVPHYAGPLPPGGAHPLGTDTGATSGHALPTGRGRRCSSAGSP